MALSDCNKFIKKNNNNRSKVYILAGFVVRKFYHRSGMKLVFTVIQEYEVVCMFCFVWKFQIIELKVNTLIVVQTEEIRKKSYFLFSDPVTKALPLPPP